MLDQRLSEAYDLLEVDSEPLNTHWHEVPHLPTCWLPIVHQTVRSALVMWKLKQDLWIRPGAIGERSGGHGVFRLRRHLRNRCPVTSAAFFS